MPPPQQRAGRWLWHGASVPNEPAKEQAISAEEDKADLVAVAMEAQQQIHPIGELEDDGCPKSGSRKIIADSSVSHASIMMPIRLKEAAMAETRGSPLRKMPCRRMVTPI